MPTSTGRASLAYALYPIVHWPAGRHDAIFGGMWCVWCGRMAQLSGVTVGGVGSALRQPLDVEPSLFVSDKRLGSL